MDVETFLALAKESNYPPLKDSDEKALREDIANVVNSYLGDEGLTAEQKAQVIDTIEAAAKFIEWFTSEQQQVDFAGVNGPEKAFTAFPIPSRLSAVQKMTASGNLVYGQELSAMLSGSKPVFPGGAPTWYPQFSNAVYTNLHAAATGSMSVDDAIKAMGDTATKLSSGQ